MKTFIRAQSAPWSTGVDLAIFSEDKKSIVKEILLEKYEDFMEPRPSFSLGRDQAQVLMDDLWNAGIRPTEGTGSAGSLRATERHLEDMRRLVFKKPEDSIEISRDYLDQKIKKDIIGL